MADRAAFSRRGDRWSDRALFVSSLDPDGSVQTMRRVDMSGRTAKHNENWLQDLIHRYPQTVPVHELEPAFGSPIPLGREMPVRTGFVDNVFATAEGNIILVECKLWRNAEARREVVAQIIDYAHCLSTWTYAELEAAIRKSGGRGAAGNPASLYEIVSTHTDDALNEPDFIDAVSRNLRLGRLLLLVLGDGIHESAETLADYLQEHAGFHFTFGLVEVQVHELPDGGYVVQPRILTRTVNIERGIVRIDGDRAIVAPPPVQTSGGRTTSISEAQLFEALARIDPALPARLQDFIDQLSDCGVTLEPATRTLVLRWRGDSGIKFNLGAINQNAEVYTDYLNGQVDKLGRIDIGHAYQTKLAELIGGEVRQTSDPKNWYVKTGGKSGAYLLDLLEKSDGWAAAIQEFIEAARQAELDDQSRK